MVKNKNKTKLCGLFKEVAINSQGCKATQVGVGRGWYSQIQKEGSDLFGSSNWEKGRYAYDTSFPNFDRMSKGGSSVEEMRQQVMLLEEQQIIDPEDREKGAGYLTLFTELQI